MAKNMEYSFVISFWIIWNKLTKNTFIIYSYVSWSFKCPTCRKTFENALSYISSHVWCWTHRVINFQWFFKNIYCTSDYFDLQCDLKCSWFWYIPQASFHFKIKMSRFLQLKNIYILAEIILKWLYVPWGYIETCWCNFFPNPPYRLHNSSVFLQIKVLTKQLGIFMKISRGKCAMYLSRFLLFVWDIFDFSCRNEFFYYYLRMTEQCIEKISDIDYQKLLPDISSPSNLCNISDEEIDE